MKQVATDTTQLDQAYKLFTEGRAAKSQKTESPNIQEVSREEFLTQLYTLHEAYVEREFSEGYMANLLGVPQIDLIHIKLILGLEG